MLEGTELLYYVCLSVRPPVCHTCGQRGLQSGRASHVFARVHSSRKCTISVVSSNKLTKIPYVWWISNRRSKCNINGSHHSHNSQITSWHAHAFIRRTCQPFNCPFRKCDTRFFCSYHYFPMQTIQMEHFAEVTLQVLPSIPKVPIGHLIHKSLLQ